MRTYGQYCPISRAAEVLAERWTLLVVRNLLLGCTTFTEIAHGVPAMSRSLLAQRLRALEDAGVIETRRPRDRRATHYALTEAGRGLWDVVRPLAAWGERWLTLRPEHSDPSVVLWAWINFHLAHDALPARRVVVQFDFPEQPPAHRRFWVLFQRSGAEICYAPPGLPIDLAVKAGSEALTRWHVGAIEWRDAVRSGAIQVTGPPALARALPTWNRRAVVAAPRS
jgi:DNA-binding HxlR family transcriptional regulator